MKLTTKGLLLIAIPTVFELILLGGLVKAQANAAEAQRWVLQSQEVLRRTNAILEPLLVETVHMRGAVIANDRHFETPPALWVDLDRKIDGLVNLVADNPLQVGRCALIRQSVQAYRQWSGRVQDLLRNGRRDDVLARFRAQQKNDVIDQVRNQVGAFAADELYIDARRLARVQAVRAYQQKLIAAAAWGPLLMMAMAVYLYIRDLRGRFARLSNHALRLADNAPLGPLLSGVDEIARLDIILHETSSRLLASERLRARFQKDLSQRAEELAQINETLRQQTQDNEMFIYSVSHDLRTPLVNLQGFSQALAQACDALRACVRESSLTSQARLRMERLIDGEISEALRYLQSAVLRAAHIIDALLRLSHAGRVEYRFGPVDTNKLVQHVIDAMQASIRASHATITVHALPLVWGEPTVLEQVFANLIGNAINYLSNERPAHIEVGVLPIAPALSGAQSHLLRIFYVKDNGLGIAAQAMPRLFNVFQRLHADVTQGEGIGLALVRCMVERHGGRVWAESTEGVGTTFYFSLNEMRAGAIAHD